MKNCDARIESYMDAVESGTVRASKEVIALMAHVRKCFETEDIYVDQEQLTNYLGLAHYFPYDKIFPWQEFVIGLHDCTYWRVTNMPRWSDLFCLIGRGAGKDGTIALESVALSSEYNGIREYDVDICANNESQALRPVQDIIGAFEQPKYQKKLERFFRWTREKVVNRTTRSTIKGHTNNPKGKDGLRSGMVILNEIHQYKDYKNINVFTTGLGKKKHPRRSYYTTQGDEREGPLDDLLETSENILFGEEPDNGLLPFICKLDSKDEVHDEANWEKANPSLRYLPDLMLEIRKEYQDWLKMPGKFTAFMTKRMNIPDGTSEIKVCDYEKIKATNKPIPDLTGKLCTCGIDFSKITDMVSVNLHFREGDMRYDLNHSWLCKQSKDIPRMKCPWKEWEKNGLLTVVDNVEIHPQLIVDYIAEQMQFYSIKKIAIDDYRYALLAKYLEQIGFDAKIYKNLKLVRPSDIMRTATVIDSCFVNEYFAWGNNPVLRWATNNTKLVRHNRKNGSEEDADMGNFVYAKIEAKSRKTDPFMALVASMTIENEIPYAQASNAPDLGVFTF